MVKTSVIYRLAKQDPEKAMAYLNEHMPDAKCLHCNVKGMTRMEHLNGKCNDCLGREQARINHSRMTNGDPPAFCTCQDLPDDEFHYRGTAYRFDPDFPGHRQMARPIKIGNAESSGFASGQVPVFKKCGTWKRFLEGRPQQAKDSGRRGQMPLA